MRIPILTSLFCFCFLIIVLPTSQAQGVSINTDGSDPDASAALDISTTSKGVLLPRLTAAQKTAISSPATGLMIYQTDGTAGYYYYDGSSWLLVGDPLVPSGSTILSDSPTNSGLTDNGFTLIGKTSLAISPFLGSVESWTATTTTGAPSARSGHEAFWTGTEIIIWGGSNASGARYNPITDSWTAMTSASDTRNRYSSVWTGSEMIIWGGSITYVGRVNTGYRYAPSTDSWTSMSTSGAPSSRYSPSAVWTGTEMIVWGGYTSTGQANEGARYNPSSDSWTSMSASGTPTACTDPLMVWTGDKVLVWADEDGGMYDPDTDSWTSISTTNGPTYGAGYIDYKMVWGDSTAFVFGAGEIKEYDPDTDTWTNIAAPAIPYDRGESTVFWVGGKLLFWGGYYEDYSMNMTYYNTGAIYNPATATWTNMTETGAPVVRYYHAGVWTGTELLIWGGNTGSGNTNTGAKYVPGGFGNASTTDYYLYEKD